MSLGCATIPNFKNNICSGNDISFTIFATNLQLGILINYLFLFHVTKNGKHR